jgi:hypothetical protein
MVLSFDSVAESRDGYGKAYPNALLNGFFPVWAILLLSLAGKKTLSALI